MSYPVAGIGFTFTYFDSSENGGYADRSSSAAMTIKNGTPNKTEMEALCDMKNTTVVVLLLYSAIFMAGLVGNSLVVIVVSFNQRMRNTTNLLIINLAVADLLFIVACVPFTASDYVLSCWPLGTLVCKCVRYLIAVTMYVSIYTLVLMSLDRFLAVVYPIVSRRVRTEENARTAIVIIWGAVLVLLVPVMLMYGEVSRGTRDEAVCTYCVYMYQHKINDNMVISRKAFGIFFFLTSYAIPLALICGLYLVMLMRLWKGVAPGGHVSAESKRGKKRVTRLVVIVVAVFAFCWFPIQIILLLKSVDYYELTKVNVGLQITSQVLAYMNSCLNPILYAFLSDNFRKAFRKVIWFLDDPNQQSRMANGRQDERSVNQTRTTRINNDIV